MKRIEKPYTKENYIIQRRRSIMRYLSSDDKPFKKFKDKLNPFTNPQTAKTSQKL